MTEAELKERLIRMESLLEFLAGRTEDDRAIGRAREARLRKLGIKVHGTMDKRDSDDVAVDLTFGVTAIAWGCYVFYEAP